MPKDIEFNDRVQPIQYTSEEVPDGEEVEFLGWGKIRVCKFKNKIV